MKRCEACVDKRAGSSDSIPFCQPVFAGCRSVLFSATRYGATQFSVPSIDIIFDWEGLTGRMFMLALLACVYLLAFKRPGYLFLFSFFAMSIFIDYNSVLFSQYPVWVASMIPLIFLDVKDEELQ